MSSTENRLAVVLETLVDGWRRKDLSSTERLLHEQVIWNGLRADLVCHGRQEVMETLRSQLEGDIGIERLELMQGPDAVVMGFGGPRIQEVAGVPLGGQIYQVLYFDSDRIVRMQDFTTRQDALRAAGVVEEDGTRSDPDGE